MSKRKFGDQERKKLEKESTIGQNLLKMPQLQKNFQNNILKFI